MIFTSNANRPFHYGPFPLERLARLTPDALDDDQAPHDCPRAEPADTSGLTPFAKAVHDYHALFRELRDGPIAPAPAPLPADVAVTTADIKGSAYFLDASQVGICRMDAASWYSGAALAGHTHAIAIIVEHGRDIEPDNLARQWTAGAIAAVAAMRACEIAVCIAAHVRQMGFAAVAHDPERDGVDVERIMRRAGLATLHPSGLVNPFLDRRFAAAAVTTALGLVVDGPLVTNARDAKGLAYFLGIGGAVSGLERRRQGARASHLSRYPMEQVRRVDQPTTLILADEVPRVPKRAAFFERALQGDLGTKAQQERWRFAFKHPLAAAMTGLIRAMVPKQDGAQAGEQAPLADAEANSNAIKSLAYLLGADLAGICEIPDYAWFSHHADGRPIEPYHRYAVVMLIDQGYETMEGASGDDFISGAQSMRAYMRGAEIAGVMAQFVRALGHPARPQTNADSDVLHIPLILWAGLGELSRIGELVLNPFVGPRFKSVVMTTDLPLVPDRPIDFGLQTFCSSCLKCARECPCDAIPFGGKVMFNGYEIWKPDVERCTRYRLTNKRGLACGRCMKTCPLNKVVTLDGPIYTQVASWLGVNAMWLKPVLAPLAAKLDDWLGNGVRNPVKKWWLDLEIVDGRCIVPPHGANQRDLDIHRKIDVAKHKVAYYHANRMPPPDAGTTPHPVDRKQALEAAAIVETPDGARARRAKGGPAPDHYSPSPIRQ